MASQMTISLDGSRPAVVAAESQLSSSIPLDEMTNAEAKAAGYAKCYTHRAWHPRSVFGHLQSSIGGICREAGAANMANSRHRTGEHVGTYPVGVGHRKYEISPALASLSHSKEVEDRSERLQKQAAAAAIRWHAGREAGGTYPLGVGSRKYQIPGELSGLPNSKSAVGSDEWKNSQPLAERWPFARDESELLNAIDAAVPKNLPREMRAEICQDLALSVVSGEIAIGDLEAMVPEARTNFYRSYYRRYTDVQLSTPMYKNDDRTVLADTLIADPERDYTTPIHNMQSEARQALGWHNEARTERDVIDYQLSQAVEDLHDWQAATERVATERIGAQGNPSEKVQIARGEVAMRELLARAVDPHTDPWVHQPIGVLQGLGDAALNLSVLRGEQELRVASVAVSEDESREEKKMALEQKNGVNLTPEQRADLVEVHTGIALDQGAETAAAARGQAEKEVTEIETGLTPEQIQAAGEFDKHFGANAKEFLDRPDRDEYRLAEQEHRGEMADLQVKEWTRETAPGNVVEPELSAEELMDLRRDNDLEIDPEDIPTPLERHHQDLGRLNESDTRVRQLEHPVTRGDLDPIEAQANTLEMDLRVAANGAPDISEAALLNGSADAAQTEVDLATEVDPATLQQLTRDTPQDLRENLARKAELYSESLGAGRDSSLGAATEKFAGDIRNGRDAIDLTQWFEPQAGLSDQSNERLAGATHERVIEGLTPLIQEAQNLGIQVDTGTAKIAKSNQIQEDLSASNAKLGF